MSALPKFAVALFCLLALRQSGVGDELPPQQRLVQPRTVLSSTRRFLVSGLPAARAAEIARWAEEVADRISNQLGPIPFERGEILQIEGGMGSVSEPVIHAGQGCRDGEIWQKLTLHGLDELDVEQAEEALGSLLISRYVQAMQEPTARCVEPARVPDWLAVGIVHRGQNEVRRRDQAAAIERWGVGELEPFSSLLERYYMPPGRWPQKADATLLVNWLMDSPRGSALFFDAFRVHAQSHAPDATWWAQQMVGRADIVRAERAWDLWVAEQHDKTQAVAAGDVRVLLKMNVIPREDLEAAGGPLELAAAPLSALIDERKEPWVHSFAIRLALRFRLESIGQEEEAVGLAERYARYLDFVAKGSSARKLKALWKEAEQHRVALEAVVAARRRYLDAVEDRLQPQGTESDVVQRYLDSVEPRLSAP